MHPDADPETEGLAREALGKDLVGSPAMPTDGLSGLVRTGPLTAALTTFRGPDGLTRPVERSVVSVAERCGPADLPSEVERMIGRCQPLPLNRGCSPHPR